MKIGRKLHSSAPPEISVIGCRGGAPSHDQERSHPLIIAAGNNLQRTGHSHIATSDPCPARTGDRGQIRLHVHEHGQNQPIGGVVVQINAEGALQNERVQDVQRAVAVDHEIRHCRTADRETRRVAIERGQSNRRASRNHNRGGFSDHAAVLIVNDNLGNVLVARQRTGRRRNRKSDVLRRCIDHQGIIPGQGEAGDFIGDQRQINPRREAATVDDEHPVAAKCQQGIAGRS